MTLQDHLGAKASLPKTGPDTGAGVEKAMTAGLGLETDGIVYTDFFFAVG